MQAILTIFALAIAVWALVVARRGSLLVLAGASVILGYTFTHHFWRLGFGPISLTLGRLFVVGLMLMLAWRWRQGKLDWRPLTGCDWLAALFVGYLTLRYIFTAPADQFASSVSPTWRIIASFWIPAALYLAARYSELTERSWKTLLTCLAVLGVYLASTGIAEVFQQWWAVFPQYIADPQLGTHFGRARGPALMSASLGVFLAVSFWAAWFLWARVSRVWQLLLICAMGLMTIGLYFTYTRSCWMGLAAGLAVVPLLHFPRSWRPVLLAGMLLVGTAGALVAGDNLINMGRDDSDGSAGHSVYQRLSFLHVSLRMFADNPITGCGFGRFYDRKMPYLSERTQQIELESIRKLDHHNTYLSLLTETGLIGFSLFVGMLAAWGRLAWNLARDATAENWMRAQGLFGLATLFVYMVNAMFHDLTLNAHEHWLLCLVIGTTVGMVSARRAAASQAATVPTTVEKSQLGWSGLTT